MNTRNLYHSLLWLSAACIAVLGFLLIQAHTSAVQLKDELRAANTRSAMYQSHTPQELTRKAQSIVERREKWNGEKIGCHTYYNSHQGWSVSVYKQGSLNTNSYMSQCVLLDFDNSGNLTSYRHLPGGRIIEAVSFFHRTGAQ